MGGTGVILNGCAALLTYAASVCHADCYWPACDVITRIHSAFFPDEIKGGEGWALGEVFKWVIEALG